MYLDLAEMARETSLSEMRYCCCYFRASFASRMWGDLLMLARARCEAGGRWKGNILRLKTAPQPPMLPRMYVTAANINAIFSITPTQDIVN